MASKKKSIGEKIAEKVDHVLHPSSGESAVETSDESSEEIDNGEKAESLEPSRKSESQAKMKHPKFDKFK